jgi:hypothetical protein
MVLYSEISTREIVEIGDLVQRALAYSITKRARKSLGNREIWVKRDPVTGLVWRSASGKPFEILPS